MWKNVQLVYCASSITNCQLRKIDRSWSSLDEGAEGSYRPNCQTNLVKVLRELSLQLYNLINTTCAVIALHVTWTTGRKKLSFPDKLLRIFSLQQNRESKVPQKKIFLNWGKDFSILLFAVSTPYSLSCLAAVMPGLTFVVHWKITIKTF